MHSYGEIVTIDLASGTVKRDFVPLQLAKKFGGGRGINNWLLWQHFLDVDPHVDPRSKDNVLIVGIGPLGATGFGLGSNTQFTFKSPVTSFFGNSTCGGNFSSQMRWAGVDYLVIKGRAKKPVYLYIEDSSVDIRDARHLWGLGTYETVGRLRSEEVPSRAGVACIGQAGENRVRYASIVPTERCAARGAGAGCVAGSKNLKAIVAIGTRGIAVHDSDAAGRAAARIFDAIDAHPLTYALKKDGAFNMLEVRDLIDYNTYGSNQLLKVPDENIRRLSPEWYSAHMKLRDLACSPGCTFGCDSSCRIKGDETELAKRLSGFVDSGLEYASVTIFGLGCDIPDLAAIAYLHRICNDHGIDHKEIGRIVSFLMELWQHGIITKEHTRKWFGEPVSLEWGNFDVVEKIIRAVALQESKLGKICSHSVEKTAEMLENITDIPTTPYLNYRKGAGAFHEKMRLFPICVLNSAVSSRWCEHVDGAAAAVAENHVAAINCLGICSLWPLTDLLFMPLNLFTDAYSALTGIPLTVQALLLAGERACNLEKAFNSRMGLRRKDRPPVSSRMAERPPTESDRDAKERDNLGEFLDKYYENHGWDKLTSLQTREKLVSLGLSDVADVLEGQMAVVTS